MMLDRNYPHVMLLPPQHIFPVIILLFFNRQDITGKTAGRPSGVWRLPSSPPGPRGRSLGPPPSSVMQRIVEPLGQ